MQSSKKRKRRKSFQRRQKEAETFGQMSAAAKISDISAIALLELTKAAPFLGGDAPQIAERQIFIDNPSDPSDYTYAASKKGVAGFSDPTSRRTHRHHFSCSAVFLRPQHGIALFIFPHRWENCLWAVVCGRPRACRFREPVR